MKDLAVALGVVASVFEVLREGLPGDSLRRGVAEAVVEVPNLKRVRER